MIKKESVRKGAFSTSVLNVVGRAIGFFSVFLISYLFGANKDTDIFYFLLSFTALIITLFTSLYTSVFLPLFIKIKEQEGNHKAWQFLNSLFGYTVIFSILLGSVYFLWSVKIISHFSNFSPAVLLLSKNILAFFAPVITFMLLVEFLKTVIQSQYQFTLPALSVLFNSVINILLLVVLGKVYGIKIMAVSVLVSYLSQFIFLFRYIKKHEPLFSIRFRYSKHHNIFWGLSAPVIITQLFSVISMFYYDYSATIFSAGTLTSITLALKVFSLPNDMIISPLSNVVAPVFSENSASYDFKRFNKNLVKYNNTIWLIIIPISFFFLFFSDSIIQLLFLRGEFTAENARVSTITLKLLSFGLFGYSFHALATRAFFAMQKTYLLSIVSLAVSLVSIGMTYLFVKELGYTGIPLSRSLSVLLLSVGSSLLLLRAYLPNFKFLDIVVPFIKMTVAATIAALVAFLFFKTISSFSITENNFINTAFSFSFAIPIFITIYGGMCYVLKIDEFLENISFIKNKILITLKFLKA